MGYRFGNKKDFPKTDGKTMDIRRHFECWDDLLEMADKNPDSDDWRSSRNSDTGWSGTPSFKAAMKLCREGWPAGRKKILDLKDKLKDDFFNKMKKVDIQWDVVGEQVDVGRFIEGVPECMAVFNTKDGMGKGVVTIMLNIAASNNVPTDVITRRGAAALTIVDVLEDMGFRCEVRFGQAVKPSGYGTTRDDFYEVATVLKHAAQAVDLDTLAFALAHPSMLRRIIFSVEENEEEAIRYRFGFTKELGGYGYPAEMRSLDDVDMLFPHLNYSEKERFKNDDKTVNWVTEQINKILSESESDARVAKHESH
jgi:hypothetical protein